MKQRTLVILVGAALAFDDAAADLKALALSTGLTEEQWENAALTLSMPVEAPPPPPQEAHERFSAAAPEPDPAYIDSPPMEWTDTQPGDATLWPGDIVLYRDNMQRGVREYKLVPKGTGISAEPGVYPLRAPRK